jgi:isocitrate dehydrogenase kinase/phosphatase
VATRKAADLPASRLANIAVPAIVQGLENYDHAFAAITRRAGGRFERCEWKETVADAIERLDLYGNVVDETERLVRGMLGGRVNDRLVWASMKAVYSGLIANREDCELAETFFNSVTRRIFSTVGVDGNIEFVDSDFEAPPPAPPTSLLRIYEEPGDNMRLIKAILRDSCRGRLFQDLDRDATLTAERISAALASAGLRGAVDRAEIVRAPFFRRKGAYLLGRIISGSSAIPLAIALLNSERGAVVDAVLTDQEDLSILFSFTRSHFHVDLGAPYHLVRFLRLLMPRKPIAELYIALGHHKHGKTELYRDLLRHLRESDERFVPAAGTPGTVMMVFTLPGHDVVVKVIRDRFPAIKPVTPGDVRRNYRLVFRHDRAGRLVEAQEFEHLQFERARFSPDLLEQFQRDADRTVAVGPDVVVVQHAYVERRVTPLDVHLREAVPEVARAAVADFGQAVKDLAASGIFPGELLPKNFGVTRHSRVVCYDYDELGLLVDFNFRSLPAPQLDEDEYGDEAWFGAGPRDVFPEEFQRFLALPLALRETLDRRHGELYGVRFWQDMQAQVGSGEVLDIFPYEQSRRLRIDR